MRKLSTDALIVFGADAGARLLGFLAAAHLARTLHEDGFGTIVIGLSFLSYVLWFVDLGIGTLGTRELGRPQSERLYTPSQILWTRIALGFLVMLPAAAVAALIYHAEPLRYVVCAYLLNAVPYALTLEWYFQGIQRYRPLVISRTVSAALYLGFLYLLVQQSGDLIRVPWLYAASTLLPALLLFLFTRAGDSFSPRGLRIAESGRLVRSASVIGAGGIAAQTVQLLPPLVLGAYSTAQAGLLGAALRIVAVVLIVDRVFAVLFLPAVTRHLGTRRQEAGPAIERVLRLVIATGAALAVPIAIYAPGILRLVFGAGYEAGAEALAITAWFAAITLVNSVFVYGLIGAGAERAFFRAAVASAAITAVLTVAGVYFMGLAGAALAMTASEVAVVLLTWREFRRVVHVRWARPLLTAIGVAALILGAAFLLHPDRLSPAFLWQGPLAALLVVGLTIALGGLRREDIIWVLKR